MLLPCLFGHGVEILTPILLFVFFFLPGAGEPEEAGRDNPAAHVRVRERH